MPDLKKIIQNRLKMFINRLRTNDQLEKWDFNNFPNPKLGHGGLGMSADVITGAFCTNLCEIRVGFGELLDDSEKIRKALNKGTTFSKLVGIIYDNSSKTIIGYKAWIKNIIATLLKKYASDAPIKLDDKMSEHLNTRKKLSGFLSDLNNELYSCLFYEASEEDAGDTVESALNSIAQKCMVE